MSLPLKPPSHPRPGFHTFAPDLPASGAAIFPAFTCSRPPPMAHPNAHRMGLADTRPGPAKEVSLPPPGGLQAAPYPPVPVILFPRRWDKDTQAFLSPLGKGRYHRAPRNPGAFGTPGMCRGLARKAAGARLCMTWSQSEPQFPHLGGGAPPPSPLSLGHGFLQGPKGDKGSRGDLVSGRAGGQGGGAGGGQGGGPAQPAPLTLSPRFCPLPGIARSEGEWAGV